MFRIQQAFSGQYTGCSKYSIVVPNSILIAQGFSICVPDSIFGVQGTSQLLQGTFEFTGYSTVFSDSIPDVPNRGVCSENM